MVTALLEQPDLPNAQQGAPQDSTGKTIVERSFLLLQLIKLYYQLRKHDIDEKLLEMLDLIIRLHPTLTNQELNELCTSVLSKIYDELKQKGDVT